MVVEVVVGGDSHLSSGGVGGEVRPLTCSCSITHFILLPVAVPATVVRFLAGCKCYAQSASFWKVARFSALSCCSSERCIIHTQRGLSSTQSRCDCDTTNQI